MASIAFKISLCKERLDLTVGVDDIFYSFIWHTGIDFENQNWSYTQTNDTRRFRIALNYKFGKMKIEERVVNQSNEEEKGRLKH
jgi:outer membrane receptor for ferrienterochelin and colicin